MKKKENEIEIRLRKNIGKKIKIERTKTNYTQEQLAEKAELSTRYISQLERGISFGSASTIVNLCKALNISPDFLFNDLIADSGTFPAMPIIISTAKFSIMPHIGISGPILPPDL